MTKWNQLGCALGGSDSCDSCDFKRIALWRFQAADTGNRRALHTNEGVSNSGARCCRLGADIHHLHAAPAGVVRKYFHRHWFLCKARKGRVAAGYRPFRRLRASASIHARPKSNFREQLLQYHLILPSAMLLRLLVHRAISPEREENVREAVSRPPGVQAWL